MTERRPDTAPRLQILAAEDGHAAAIAEFIRTVWSPDATAESVVDARRAEAIANLAEPGLPPPTWIALLGSKVVGYVTTLPIRLWDGQRDWPAYWIKGLMVLPENRNGPIGFLLLKAAVARLQRTGALAVAPPARRLFEALGYTDRGAIPNWIRPIAPGRMLQRLDLTALGMASLPTWAGPVLRAGRATGVAGALGWMGGLALRSTATVRRGLQRSFHSGPFDPTQGAALELDELWAAVRSRFPSGVVRDSRYLLGRYGGESGRPYLWVAVRRRGTLAGIAILRRPRPHGDARLKGIRIAALADVLYAPDQTAAGLALLGAVERAARALQADAVVASASAPALQSLLKAQWYLPISGNVHLLFRDISGDPTTFGRALDGWWLTRGDGLADEVF